MTVGELIEQLEDFREDAEVFVVQSTARGDKFFTLDAGYTSHPTDPDADDVVQLEIGDEPVSVKR